MTLYEIDEAILDCIDAESGEIIDVDALTQLQMERDAKIENVALWIKDLVAESLAIKTEEINLKARREAAERKAKSLEAWLRIATDGQKFKTSKVAITFRKSTAVVVTDESKIPSQFINEKVTTSVDKKALREALSADDCEIAGAMLVENSNIQIK